MGSCCSCLCRDSVPDNHPTKFKVTNVDDEGNELGSGIMELTQRELVLHTHKRDAVRWPYLCLRRYGYDSNLFSFESGRRCQTGQGIFAFKCSRAEDIFNLLQDLMQCNRINVVEEPVVLTRNSHVAELDIPRTPQTPNTLGYTVPGFPNGFHSFSGEVPPCSAARHPSMSSMRHSSVGEDSTHALIVPDDSHTYVNTASGEEAMRGRHCMHSLPEVHSSVPHSNHSCSLEDRNPQIYLQPGEVKFVLGPAHGYRHMMKCEGFCRPHWECAGHICTPNNNNNECKDECLAPKCVYENINGLLPSRGTVLRRGGGGRLKIAREDLNFPSCSHRRNTLLHYENLPSLPPVWESQPLRQVQTEDDSGDAMTPSPNGYPEPEEDDPLQNYLNSESATLHGGLRRGGCLQRRRSCTPSVFNFDFRRPCLEQQRQLNYIQVELEDDPCKGHQSAPVSHAQLSAVHPVRRADSYAVIDLKKTAAMSSLQRALPRDDGTSRKTRHNSTDLPL